MSKKANPTVIGGFVVGAVLLFAAGVALFGGSELFAKRFIYVAYFEEQTKGLRVGSNVVLNGVRIGYVSEIALLIDEDFTIPKDDTINWELVSWSYQYNITWDYFAWIDTACLTFPNYGCFQASGQFKLLDPFSGKKFLKGIQGDIKYHHSQA